VIADLTGKVALVTGGGDGIGRGIVVALAEQGADVAVLDISADTAESTTDAVQSLGRRALSLIADVSDRGQVDQAMAHAIDELGQLDVLVNNAGIGTPVDDDDRWRKTLDVNLMGVVHCCEAAVPHMQERRYGKIVNIASMAAHGSRRRGGAYAVAKAAVQRYTTGLAAELAEDSINVNAICPGAVWTSLQRRGADRQSGQSVSYDDFLEKYEGVIPMGRPQTPEDVGKAAAFLASDDSANITGQCLHVDGGAILRD
jgi:meso-butanediol dehydrogenase/(S,S)-butanediol dehydrogenase/diacetyl reductase